MRITGSPGRRQVLTLWRPGHGALTPAADDQLKRRLRAMYGPVFGTGVNVATRRVEPANVLIALVEDGGSRERLEDLIVWGDPIGQGGRASAAEVESALSDDRALGRLLGSFVLVRIEPDRVTVCSGADLVHTLMHCAGPDGEAWATRAFAASVASGHRPRVVAERVPEYLAYDFVFSDDHLLEGVTVLPEASRLVVTGPAVHCASWWPEGDRLRGRRDDGPGRSHGADPADGGEIVSAVGDALARIVRTEEVCLALTSGRDSTLLAGVTASFGGRLPAFTMGGPQTPDGAGAAAIAEALGWPHRHVLPPAEPQPSIDRLLKLTRLSEGMDTAWNFYGPDLEWPADLPPARIAGVGGEMGRALYWAGITDPELLADPARAMSWWPARTMAADGAAAFRSRCQAYADRLYDDGWRGTGIFDGWHARGRVRRWVGSTPPPPGTGVWTVYTHPSVARVLLALPAEDRVRATSFDEAARRTGGLREVAEHAAMALPRPSRWRSGRVSGRLDRALHPDAGYDWVRRCLGELVTTAPIAAEIMGTEWWQDELVAVHRRRRSPHQLWNAIAVEALRHVAEQVSAQL